MVRPATLEKWLQRGKQKAAVARVLRKPMTTTEIRRAAHSLNPHIQLRDIWFIMGQFEKCGLVRCLNPRDITGKFYYWTEKGKKVVQSAFGFTIRSPPRNVDWSLSAHVIRGKVRRFVLLELKKMRAVGNEAKTAIQIRRNLKDQYHVGLNSVKTALKALSARKLVQCVGVTEKWKQKLYRLTEMGRRIVDQLENSDLFTANPF